MAKMTCSILVFLFLLCDASCAKDFLLTIGGGYSPSGNQASLEKNVLFYQRLIKEQKSGDIHHTVFFADGHSNGKDLQVMDREAIPKANRLMAEFFGSQTNLGLKYRNHQVPNIRGATKPVNIRLWFDEIGPTMKSGDRLIIYVTSHGKRSEDRNREYDTSISLWNNSSIRVSQLVSMLDRLPLGVEVVAVMVQCHAGGFARFIFNEGDPGKGLSTQKRSGFFATVHDRPAAGCTPEVDEASYVEYSTYFWSAIAGHDRLNADIEIPDYDNDGQVCFAEAHAYTVLAANTIDLPIKTSGEFLSVYSRFGNRQNPDLLTDTTPYDELLKYATTIQKVVLEGLSKELKLTGRNRLEDAYQRTQSRGRSRSGFRGRSRERPGSQLRRKISGDLKRRWPELSNVLNPLSVEFVTTRSDEFIRTVEGHADYKQYCKEVEAGEGEPDDQKRRVKFERFLRVADNVLLAENLKRMDNPLRLEQYMQIVAAESESL